MGNMKMEEAKRQLSSLKRENKYETMIKTAGIITKMLEKDNRKPSPFIRLFERRTLFL